MEYIDKYVWYQEGPGVRKNQYTTEGIKLLNVANLIDGKLDLSTSERYISEEEAKEKYNHFLVDEGDLIIASSGIKVEYFDKKMGFVKREQLPLCMNTSTIRFKVKDDKITSIRYFMYFLKSELFKKQLNKLITGSAQLNFGPSHLKKIKVNMPTIDRQIYISNQLDICQKIIDYRKKQVEALNDIIKSQFVEMFGNIVLNENKYETIQLKNISDIKSGGTPSRNHPEYFQGNIPWITTVALGKNTIDNKDAIELITQEAIEKSATKIIEEESLLFGTRVGVGKISMNLVPMCTNQDIVAITKIDNRFRKLFLKKAIEEYSDYFNNQKRGATIQGITTGILKEIEIPIVSIDEQDRFINLVKQIDKQKFEIETSLKEIETLYETLMAKYFE